MSKPAIDIQHLGKRYRLGEGAGSDRTLVETLSGAMRSIVSRPRQAARRKSFWALRDVNLRVEPGEVMGIIGRNGAGKSTLLKILSRITEPTRGRVELRGRVASLLEVGTGFHPELTGRENIYLNGAILGMSRREVRTKFDAIIEFSGVEKFLDTPVKRYSSGMRVRLAFAVAAHLDPEILIVDEVLAVGDAAFQRRCLGKMQEVATRGGRTVLFVSHNMAAVQNLCAWSAWLEHGRVRQAGPTAAVTAAYLRQSDTPDEAGEGLTRFRSHGAREVIRSVDLCDSEGRIVHAVPAGAAVELRVRYTHDNTLQRPCFGIGIDTAEGQRLILLQTRLQHGAMEHLPASGVVRCRLPRLPLTPGRYTLSLSCEDENGELDRLERAVAFDVVQQDVYGTGQLPRPHQGCILIDAQWRFDSTAPAAILLKQAS